MMDNTIQQLTEEVMVWLNKPLSRGIDETYEHSDKLLLELQRSLKNNKETRRILGPLIGQVKTMQKRLKAIELVNWTMVKSGKLAIGHRPSTKLISDIRLQGGSHILTLLSESEGAKIIEKESKKEGLHWLWFAMNSALPPTEDKTPELKSLFANMADALENHASIYIHCSAGIHRTGMITYGFLRYLGLTSEAAKDLLKQLRYKTWEAVGENRLLWAERFSYKEKG